MMSIQQILGIFEMKYFKRNVNTTLYSCLKKNHRRVRRGHREFGFQAKDIL